MVRELYFLQRKMRVGTLTELEAYNNGELVGRGYVIHDQSEYSRPTIFDLKGDELPNGAYYLKFGKSLPVVITDWIH